MLSKAQQSTTPWTRLEEQPQQKWHDMRPILGHEEISGDRQKADQDKVRA